MDAMKKDIHCSTMKARFATAIALLPLLYHLVSSSTLGSNCMEEEVTFWGAIYVAELEDQFYTRTTCFQERCLILT